MFLFPNFRACVSLRAVPRADTRLRIIRRSQRNSRPPRPPTPVKMLRNHLPQTTERKPA